MRPLFSAGLNSAPARADLDSLTLRGRTNSSRRTGHVGLLPCVWPMGNTLIAGFHMAWAFNPALPEVSSDPRMRSITAPLGCDCGRPIAFT